MTSQDHAYQLVACMGEYDSYVERVLMIDFDLNRVRAAKNDLRAAVQRVDLNAPRDDEAAGEGLARRLAFEAEVDNCTIVIARVNLGVLNLDITEHVEQERWTKPAFENDSMEPLDMVGEPSLFEKVVEEIERKFD